MNKSSASPIPPPLVPDAPPPAVEINSRSFDLSALREEDKESSVGPFLEEEAEGYEGELVHRIEAALRNAERILSRREPGDERARLSRENCALRSHFKVLNAMLNDLLNYKKYENYSVTMEQEAREAKEKGKKLSAETYAKRLQVYSSECDSLQRQLDRISDPKCADKLEKACTELDDDIRLRQRRLFKLQVQDRLGVYVISTDLYPRIEDDKGG